MEREKKKKSPSISLLRSKWYAHMNKYLYSRIPYSPSAIGIKVYTYVYIFTRVKEIKPESFWRWRMYIQPIYYIILLCSMYVSEGDVAMEKTILYPSDKCKSTWQYNNHKIGYSLCTWSGFQYARLSIWISIASACLVVWYIIYRYTEDKQPTHMGGLYK